MSKGATSWKLFVGICAAGAILVLGPPAASGATITVTNGGDENPSDPTNANCTLREAIANVNAANETAAPECDFDETVPFGGADTINLAAGTYTLSVVGNDEDNNLTGDLDVRTQFGNVTIQGAGAGSTTINTALGWDDRVLDHNSGNASNTLTIQSLTITGGNDTDATKGGGAINFTAGGQFPNLTVSGVRLTGNTTNASGGAIEALGGIISISNSTIGPTNTANGTTAGGITLGGQTVTVNSTAIVNNTLSNTGPIGGGGLFAGSPLTMTNSVVSGNTVNDGDAAGVPSGGGLYLQGTTTVRSTTISGNSVTGGQFPFGGGISAQGAGLGLTLINSTVSTNTSGGLRFSGNGATATVALSTFDLNTADGFGISALNPAGATTTVNVRGSVISGAAPVCNSGTITSQNDNVFSDASCGAAPGPGNDIVGDPMLGGLVFNGGPSAGAPGFEQQINTHLPASTSPAVEHVPAGNCTDVPAGQLMVDQRGAARPADSDGNGVASCEAGSVELPAPPPPGGGGAGGAAPAPVITTPAPTGQRAAALKKCKKKKSARARRNCKKRAKKLPV
jgi:hypothetical protein